MRVLARLELLVGQLDLGTGLEMVDLASVLNLEDEVTDARLQIEPAVDGRMAVVDNTSQVVDLVLLEQLDVVLNSAVAALESQPGELNRLEGPYYRMIVLNVCLLVDLWHLYMCIDISSL